MKRCARDRNRLLCCALFTLNLLASGPAFAQDKPVRLTLDTSEADQALNIMAEYQAQGSVRDEDWKLLFATVPYQWLKSRELSMGGSFSDDTFRQFLLAPSTLAKRDQWKSTLDHMKQANMTALGESVLGWLPAGAVIHARVFPEIKPQSNSFVWRKESEGPAIFLYLADQTQSQFENTVAHECHHIGLESLDARQQALQAGLPENVKRAMKWMTAFGEGEAMLAAVGSSDRHPHWEDDALIRARWDSDMMHFNENLSQVQQLLFDILNGTLSSDVEIRKRASPFWGVQGAWYTVGYEMAVLVERRFGRQVFDDCLLDPRVLLVRYNQVASEANEHGAKLAMWSPDLVSQLQPR